MKVTLLSDEITRCTKCSRLIGWAKTRQGENSNYSSETYWAKPVPGFGDGNARILIVGLAPGAHGANRTGRPFTGDAAGNYLFEGLFLCGFSNQVESISKFDGLSLKDVYITNALRCVPPKDTPRGDELQNCCGFLTKEVKLLKNIRIIVTLGAKAFIQVKKVLKELGGKVRGKKFIHDAFYDVGDGLPCIKVCYHPSRRNFDTGKMTKEELQRIIYEVKSIVGRLEV